MNEQAILKARAYYYEWLAYPLFFDEKNLNWQNFKAQSEYLALNPLASADSASWESILKSDAHTFSAEQNAVLFDMSYANIPLNVSFYEEGRDDGVARLRVIGLLKKAKYVRDILKCKDSEDFSGFVLLFASQLLLNLIKSDLNKNPSEQDLQEKILNADVLKELFSSVINGYIDEMLLMLKSHKEARFFKAYAQIFSSFISLERSIFGLMPPAPKPVSIAAAAMSKKPYQSKMPTAKSKIFWDEFTAL